MKTQIIDTPSKQAVWQQSMIHRPMKASQSAIAILHYVYTEQSHKDYSSCSSQAQKSLWLSRSTSYADGLLFSGLNRRSFYKSSRDLRLEF